MSKRSLAVFALSLISSQCLLTTPRLASTDLVFTTVIAVNPLSILASDEPVCPPGAPPPCI